MSDSNCCFLTCIQISQEAGKMGWHFHRLKNFPQFVVIHTVKCVGIVNKAEVGVFLELCWFFYDPTSWQFDFNKLVVAFLPLIPLPFLNLACTSESPWFTYCWSLAWRILSITLLAHEVVQLWGSLNILWHCLSLGLKWKLTFSSPVASVEFSKFARILSATL